MSIRVRRPGMLTTVQAQPRTGFRHLGVPASGAADPLSLALANKLVGNTLLAPALEATLTGPTLEFQSRAVFALTGGKATAILNGNDVEFHRTLSASSGDTLTIGSVEVGARVYVAFAGGISCDEVFGSSSTYMPAALGGVDGRALRDGDRLETTGVDIYSKDLVTPEEFRPPITDRWALRTCRSAETHWLVEGNRTLLFDTNWTIGRRADRMGLQLEGQELSVVSDGRMPSSPVFPGTIQCPEDGVPMLLGVDAQTTGGYARVAQVARADRHLLGQMRPGDRLRLLPRRPQDCVDELRAKHDYWRKWLPDVEAVI